MTYSDHDIDANPDQYEDAGLDVDRGADPNEGTEQPDYLEEPDDDD